MKKQITPQEKAQAFLVRYKMNPPISEISAITKRMLKEMERGLEGVHSSIKMMPTYIRGEGTLPSTGKVIVIDAGGTNLRFTLVKIERKNCTLIPIGSCRMLGTDASVTWEEFIYFIANCIMPVINQAETIAICFSFTMESTPELDGKIVSIDKEVSITGAVGHLVGESLKTELEKHGIRGKKIIVLNDSVAALIGASYSIGKETYVYDGFLGQICGTGTNTCCLLPVSKIKKLCINNTTQMYINLESGAFTDFIPGYFDKILIDNSDIKDEIIIEKLIGGRYIGMLMQLILEGAAKDGEIELDSYKNLRMKKKILTVDVDNWAAGDNLNTVAVNEADADFIREVSLSMFQRAAVYTCAGLTALMMLTGLGTSSEKPACICIEGSFAEKSRCFLPLLNDLLALYSEKNCNLHAKTIVGKGTTQIGAAIAALLN